MALKLLSYYPGEIPKALSVDKPTQTNEAGKMANSQRTMMVAKTEGSRKCPQVLLRKKMKITNRFHSEKSALGPFLASPFLDVPFLPAFLFLVPFFAVFAISLLWPLCYFDFIL